MALTTKFPTKIVLLVVIVSWCILIYIWMYISTSLLQENGMQQLFQENGMNNDIKSKYNQLQNKMNNLQNTMYNITSDIKMNNSTDNISNNKISTTPSPTAKDISLTQLLHKLNTIDINEQISTINDKIYKQEMGWNYSLNIKEIRSKKNHKSLILTAYNPGSKQLKYWLEKYGSSTMKYAYDSKLVYAKLHKNDTILILDTFDYISYLNIATKMTFTSQTNDIYAIWQAILGDKYDCTNLLDTYWWKKKQYLSTKNDGKYFFRYSYSITTHFNKILSILYWSKYFNYILWMDDDAFFGNFKVPINYYFNLIPTKLNNDIFLILPMDHNQAFVFSNFAFFINTSSTPNDRSNNFLYDWFAGRSVGFQFYDQDAMNYAILQYLVKYDYKFMKYINEYYLHIKPLEYLLFFKCIEYCKICPVDHMCLDNCLKIFDLRRCRGNDILNGDKEQCTMMINSTLFWTPWIDTNLSSLTDDYDIYPFVLQHNYGAHYRYLSNSSYRDPDLLYLQKIYDHTFIIHKRYYVKKGKLDSNDAPFLYAYTLSNSRKFVVDYLVQNELYLNETQYPTIEFQTKFKLDQLLSAYKNAKTKFYSYGGSGGKKTIDVTPRI